MSDNPYQPPADTGALNRPLRRRPHGTTARRRRYLIGLRLLGVSGMLLLGLSLGFEQFEINQRIAKSLSSGSYESFVARLWENPDPISLAFLLALVASLAMCLVSDLVMDSAFPYRLKNLRWRRIWQSAVMPALVRRRALAERQRAH